MQNKLKNDLENYFINYQAIWLLLFGLFFWSYHKQRCFIVSYKGFLSSVGADNQAEMVEESIQHAREAIILDVKDGNSWCKILQTCIML